MHIYIRYYCTINTLGQYNKSLHPISPVGPAFAWCSRGAANAGPPVETGELNRYLYLVAL